MVKTDKRHKTLAVTDLFSIQQDSSTQQYNYYSKVDGALANALYLVNLDTVPVVAFATGHNEMLTVSDNLPRSPACSTTTTLKSKSLIC